MADPGAEAHRVLILGGTSEAAALAARLAEDPRLAVTTSLAGRTLRPQPLPGNLRVGGFGGVEGLAAHLARSGTDLLVDATHPFADRISEHAAQACRHAGIARLQLLRPAWTAAPGDDWRTAGDLEAAATAVAGTGARRVFLSIGRQELAAFGGVTGPRFLVRMIDAPTEPLPLENCEVLLGRGPFHEAEEEKLLREHRIDLLVTRNSGGSATFAKLAVARSLGLPVVMVERPAQPAGACVETVERALDWIEARLATARTPAAAERP